MKKIILLLLLSMMAILLSAKEINILSLSEDKIILEFNVGDYQLGKTQLNNELYDEITPSFKAIYENVPGAPKLPYLSKAVGLPVDGEIRYKILDSKTSIKRNVNLVPIKKAELRNDSFDYVFYKEDKIYSKNSFYPDEYVTLSKSMFVRDRKFTSFFIHPFAYNPQTKELKVLNYIKIEIDIIGDKSYSKDWEESNNFIDKYADELFINNKFSKKWRKPRELADFYPPDKDTDDITQIQIIVDENGIYKITKEYLLEQIDNFLEENEIQNQVAIEWDNIDPRYLELYDENGPVPIRFEGDSDGHFDDGDYFEFYGHIHHGRESYYGHYTTRNTYILKMIDHLGSRMVVENGGLVETNSNNYIQPSSFLCTEHFEKQKILYTLGYQKPGFYKEDVYFWDEISAPILKSWKFQLHDPIRTEYKTYTAKVVVWGLSQIAGLPPNQNDHFAVVSINTDLVNQHYWKGQKEKVFESASPRPNTNLFNGDNYLYISLPGLEGISTESCLLDYFEISYWREFKAYEDYLEFEKPVDTRYGLYQFQIDNFTSSDISLYKLGSGYFENLQIEPLQESGNMLYRLTFQDSIVSPNVRYVALTEAQKKLPFMIRPDVPSNLKSPDNIADYVIITPEVFANEEAINVFVDLWNSRGHYVKIVKTEDIYDEFNHGMRSAFAIKDFIKYAYNNWQSPRLTHVLLLGDGLLDERDNSTNASINFIPFYPFWINPNWPDFRDGRGYIASDNWYACIVGEDLAPDVNIARIPIWRKEQVENVAYKSKHYMENPNYEALWHSHIILCAGGKESDEGNIFADQEEIIKNNNIPLSYNVKRIYTKTLGYPESFHGTSPDLINSINEGAIFVNFMGHGSSGIWADYGLFVQSSVDALNNRRLPLFSSLSCFGADFTNAQDVGIGEKLVNSANKGAIGFMGFTGYGLLTQDLIIGEALADGMFKKNINNVGELMSYVKIKFLSTYGIGNDYAFYTTQDLVGTFEYLGDPMIEFYYPKEKEITLDKYNLAPYDTLKMSANIQDGVLEGKFVLYHENDTQLPMNEYFPMVKPAINGVVSAQDYIIPDSLGIYTGVVKFFGYSENDEFIGHTKYTVGKSAYNEISIMPQYPTSRDSVYISGKFFDLQGIRKVVCVNDYQSHHIIHDMENIEGALYRTILPFIPQETNKVIPYHFEITDLEGNITNSPQFSYKVSGVNFILSDIHLGQYQDQLAVSLMVRNGGNIDALPTNVRLYDMTVNPHQLLSEINLDTLRSLENRWINLPIPPITKRIKFLAIINQDQTDYDGTDSLSTDYYNVNVFMVGQNDVTVTSLDGNLECFFPKECVNEPSLFYINQFYFEDTDQFEPLNQPDLSKILMETIPDDNQPRYSTVYQIGALKENALIDTLGHYANGKRVTMRFKYNSSDSDTQIGETSGDYSAYIWKDDYKKWIFKARGAVPQNDEVVYYAEKTGAYAIFVNNDKLPPSIEANVEGQEFSYGGFVSKNGIVSFLLSDANGIDIFNNDITIELNGEVVDPSQYTYSFSKGRLTHIPVKFQLDNLPKGDYNFSVICTDINGNASIANIPFKVNDTFDLINVANYPNPVLTHTTNPDNEGNTRFTYVLTDDADYVEIKVYTISGRLVKTFKNLPNSIGYHEYPRAVKGWDCRDEDGRFLANGTYIYKIIAKKGKKKIEKLMKMAILK